MIDRYIVSFAAGTSGRFICSIVWNLINDFDIEYSFTDRNSAHLYGPWGASVEAPRLELSISDDDLRFRNANRHMGNHPDVYSIIEYTDKNVNEGNPYSSGLLQTHTYPDFDIIRNRLPNAKIILITFDEDDSIEILLNIIYKNLFDPALIQGWINPLLEDNQYFYLYDKIKKISEEYNTVGLLPNKQYMKYICIDFCLWYGKFFIETTKFLDKNVNTILDENTLILKYSDIFTKENGEYIALTKISNFTKKEFKSNSLATYKKYVEGRNTFLKTTIPLIDDIKHHIKINNKKSTSIWPNIYSYKNSYSLAMIGPEYNSPNHIYNYDYHIAIDVWPNILTHNLNTTYYFEEQTVSPTYNYQYHTCNNIWPNILTYNIRPEYYFSEMVLIPNYNYKFNTTNAIWPNILTYNIRPEYYFSEFLLIPNYNYKFNTTNNIWPNILTHNLNTTYYFEKKSPTHKTNIWPNILTYNLNTTYYFEKQSVSPTYNYNYLYNTYTNIWPNILTYNLNTTYYFEEQTVSPTYNYHYHTYTNIWPNILTHNSNPAYSLGIAFANIHNANVKGPEYVVSTIMNSFSELLLPTLWSIENALQYDFNLLNQVQPWIYSINIFDLGSYTHPKIYNEFKFEYYNYKLYNFNHVGLLHTTKYPDFEVVFNRYPNTKIIIISLDEDDKLEITTNIVYKKWLTTKLEKLQPFDRMQVQTAYMDYYGKALESIDNLEKEFVDFFIKKIYNTLEKKSYFTSYVDPIIPKEHEEKILVIKHKDFFTKKDEQYLGLENLSTFINQPVNEDITYKYNSAIEKREVFVKKHLPHYEN